MREKLLLVILGRKARLQRRGDGRMSNDFRLIEVLVMETDPHPLDVEKGDFTLWHTIATIAGIDLLEEEALALNDSQ